jgi:hypothetical protein
MQPLKGEEATDREQLVGQAALIASVGGQRGWADWANPEHRLRRLLAEFIGMSGLTFVLRLLGRPIRGRDLRIAIGPCVIRPATWWGLPGRAGGRRCHRGRRRPRAARSAKVQEAGAAVGTPLGWAHARMFRSYQSYQLSRKDPNRV